MATLYRLPTGTILPFAGPLCPTCYLPCDGASYLNTSWPALYAVIGTTWGGVDPEHFNVPDLRGRVPLGTSPGGLGVDRPTERQLAQGGGQEGLTLTAAQCATPTHAHGLVGTAPLFVTTQEGSAFLSVQEGDTPLTATALTAEAGGGAATDPTPTIPPFAVINWIIKT